MSSGGLLQRNSASAFLGGGSDTEGSHALENGLTRLPGCYGFIRILKAALEVVALIGLLQGLPAFGAAPLADRIVIEKAQHRMTLWQGETLLRTYTVALGTGGLAPKTREGDGRVPEGRFHIVGRNPHSAFHLALRIDYPRPQDVAAARARGEPPGGDIMIHGLPNGGVL
jgi:L,D-transpeptidase catalytic domain